jgi:hypothetical protein
VDKDGNPVGLWRVRPPRRFRSRAQSQPQSQPESPITNTTLPIKQEKEDEIPTSSEEESSSEEDSEESSDDDTTSAGPSTHPTTAGAAAAASNDLSREARRAAAKAKKQAALRKRGQAPTQPGDLPPSDDDSASDADADTDLPANPNHSAKSRSQLVKPASDSEGDQKPQTAKKAAPKDMSQLSRREREAIEAQQARERYLKLHAEGKTDEAKADLARLAVIREQREAERLRKLAEKEEKEEKERERAALVREREDKLRQAALGKGGKKAPKKK